jgi:hypothetical protein
MQSYPHIPRLLLMIALALGGGCAANFEYAKQQGIMPVNADTFEVFIEDHRGVMARGGSLREDAVSEANEYAEGQSKVAVPLEAKQHRVGILGDWPWAYYKFRLEPKNGRTSPGPEQIIFEDDARMSNNFLATRNKTSAKTDSYDELMKLEDLRKRGILTDIEFQAQKKKILESR